MMPVTRILCPVDFSEVSRHALDHAVALAHQYRASVTALHVIAPVVSLIPSPEAPLYPPVVLTPEDIEQYRHELQGFVGEEVGAETVACHVLEGAPLGTIIEYASTNGVDLIVLGTHGRSGLERVMLGSVTERVLRKSPCPVLTVPPRMPDAVPAGPITYARIVCGVDFSASSQRAVTYAAGLARDTQAQLTLVHVVEALPVFEPVPMGGPGVAEVQQMAMDAARGSLSKMVAAELKDGPRPVELVLSGKPYRELLRVAAESHADLIVLGAHSGPAGLLAFGSTLNHVVRQAACPVLTVRA